MKLRPLYVLFVLALVSFANYYDRNLLSILVEPIKHDLHVSDTQIGLLTGLAFAVVYTLVGIPVARLADRFGRAVVLGASLSLWSAMTVVTGLSTSFTTMLLARFGVAVGEAGGLPTTHALAAEYFPASQRGKVLSTIAFFAAAGLTAATIAGGLIAEHWGWRTSFFVGGGVGLVVAVLMFLTVRDVNPPVALKAAATAPEASPRPGFRQGFAVLWKRKAFLHLCLGMAWGAFGSYAQLSWNAPFLMRAYHLTVGQVSESYGGVTAIATLLAILVGGFFSDIMTRHNARWPFWLLAVAFGFTLPAGLFTYLTHSYALVLALILPTTALASLWIGPAYALVQNLSGARLRATGAALFMLMSNLVGLGLGPSAVGVISDLLHPRFGDDSLRYALILASLTAIPATIHFLLATRSVEADIAEADADSN